MSLMQSQAYPEDFCQPARLFQHHAFSMRLPLPEAIAGVKICYPTLSSCHAAGTHRGIAGHNMATSVNHPKWVAAYVRQALPYLLKVPGPTWPRPYMKQVLAEYLIYHHDFLKSHSLWEGPAQQFVARV